MASCMSNVVVDCYHCLGCSNTSLLVFLHKQWYQKGSYWICAATPLHSTSVYTRSTTRQSTILRHSWKTLSTLVLWRLHTLVNVFLQELVVTLIITSIVCFNGAIHIGYMYRLYTKVQVSTRFTPPRAAGPRWYKYRDRTEVCNWLVSWAMWPWQRIHSLATTALP